MAGTTWFHSKDCIFLYIIVCSSPAVVRILVGRLDSCVLTHIKKYMTPIHALIFEKHVKMCVYLRQIKSQCKLIILWRSTCTQKRWLGGHFSQNSGSQGPGVRKPRWEFEGSSPEPFFHVVLRLNGL